MLIKHNTLWLMQQGWKLRLNNGEKKTIPLITENNSCTLECTKLTTCLHAFKSLGFGSLIPRKTWTSQQMLHIVLFTSGKIFCL